MWSPGDAFTPHQSLVKIFSSFAGSCRWDRGLSGGTPVPTTIIICITLCAYRYISRVRSEQVLIFMYQAMSCSGYYHGRSCPICTRCFHRCSARTPTIPPAVGCLDVSGRVSASHRHFRYKTCNLPGTTSGRVDSLLFDTTDSGIRTLTMRDWRSVVGFIKGWLSGVGQCTPVRSW